MAAITAAMVKELREMTDAGMMECKKALVEAEGDLDAAVDVLRTRGLAAVAKKAGRATNEGTVMALVSEDGKTGALVELNCETDFVGMNEKFKAYAEKLGRAALAANAADVEALKAASYESESVEDILTDAIHVLGENIQLPRATTVAAGGVATYIHGGGTHGVMVLFDTDVAGKEGFAAYGKDVAMQIAAANPGYLCEAEVPVSVIEKEKEILLAQISNDPKLAGKPEPVKVKMVEGKIGKFYKENCLLDQAYVKEPDISVSKYVENTAKELGADIEIVKFVRFEKGEGLEKRADDFAAEVASMMK